MIFAVIIFNDFLLDSVPCSLSLVSRSAISLGGVIVHTVSGLTKLSQLYSIS